MAPRRPNWKGFLRLSLVTCPVALYPATSDSEKVSFNQINRKTGHRIKYAKVDADTGEPGFNDFGRHEVDGEDGRVGALSPGHLGDGACASSAVANAWVAPSSIAFSRLFSSGSMATTFFAPA